MEAGLRASVACPREFPKCRKPQLATPAGASCRASSVIEGQQQQQPHHSVPCAGAEGGCLLSLVVVCSAGSSRVSAKVLQQAGPSDRTESCCGQQEPLKSSFASLPTVCGVLCGVLRGVLCPITAGPAGKQALHQQLQSHGVVEAARTKRKQACAARADDAPLSTIQLITSLGHAQPYRRCSRSSNAKLAT